MKRWVCATAVVAAILSMVWSVPVPLTAATDTFTAITYNTRNGRDPSGQMHIVASLTPRPDIVVLQEASTNTKDAYLSALNSEYGTSAWVGYEFPHSQTYGTCDTTSHGTY